MAYTQDWISRSIYCVDSWIWYSICQLNTIKVCSFLLNLNLFDGTVLRHFFFKIFSIPYFRNFSYVDCASHQFLEVYTFFKGSLPNLNRWPVLRSFELIFFFEVLNYFLSAFCTIFFVKFICILNKYNLARACSLNIKYTNATKSFKIFFYLFFWAVFMNVVCDYSISLNFIFHWVNFLCNADIITSWHFNSL